MGVYMNQKGLKKVFQIGPNYAAGKDMLEGMRNTYKGEVTPPATSAGSHSRLTPSAIEFNNSIALRAVYSSAKGMLRPSLRTT